MRRRSGYLAGLATAVMVASLTATADGARPAAAGQSPAPAAVTAPFEPKTVALPTDEHGWVRTGAADAERTAAPAATAPNGVTAGPVAACVPRQPICLPFTVVDNRGYVAPPNDVMEAIPFTIQANSRVTMRLDKLSTSDGSTCLSKGVRAPDGRLVDGEVFRVCPFHDGLFEWETTLSVSGTYTLLLDIGAQAGATGRVEVTIYQTPPDSTGTLSTDGRVDILSPGQRAYRVFNGTQGRTLRLTVDPGDTFNNDPNDECRLSALLRVIKPDGLNLYPTNDTWACVREQFTVTLSLPQTGEYWIKIDPDYWAVGSIDLTLSPVLAVTRCDPSSVLPIMLVHGFNGAPAAWGAMQPFLIERLKEEFARDGIPPDRAAACAPGYVRAIDVGRRGSSRANAEIIKAELADLLAATGKPRADIVAHSKGGLDARVAAATVPNPQSIRNLVMLGTANGGARMAEVGCAVTNFPAFDQTDREFREVARRVMDTQFGECNSPEDALYGLTEDFVKADLNAATADNPNVFYSTIFGNSGGSNCPICAALSPLLGPNDIVVPVHSALHLRGRGYWPIGPFNTSHLRLLFDPQVHNAVYCVGLSGRNRPDNPDPLCNGPDQTPQPPPLGHAAHIDAVPVPANGSKTVTVPVGGMGPVGVFVLSDGTGLTARIGGTDLAVFNDFFDFYGEMLLTTVNSTTNVSLTITNSNGFPISALIGVGAPPGAPTTRELDIALTPEVPATGQPVQIKVPGQTPAGLIGTVTRPDGTELPLSTFNAAGSDSVVSFTPTMPGQFRVSIGHKGTNQTRRFAFTRLVVGAGAAALPGTFRDSVTRGTDGLADVLNVDVDVNVRQAGQYALSAGLADATGKLIGHTKTTRQLAAGTSAVRLTYRGPVIYGANPGPPFQLVDVTLLRTGDAVEARAAAFGNTTSYARDTFRPARIDPGFVDVTEGGPGARVTVRVPATLTERINAPVTVNIGSHVQDGSATWPADYDPVLGNLRWLPGETTRTIPLTIKGDDLDENDEPAFIAFGGAVNATIGGFRVGAANIKDDDPVINPGFATPTAEGNTGTRTVQVPVTLAAPATAPVTVRYAPYSAAGFATPGQDFDAPTGTLTFQPGQNSKTIPLTIRADTLDESTELALIVFTDPTNGSVGGFAVGGVEITDDD